MKVLRLRDLPPELRAKVLRRPLGHGVNTLPDVWLEDYEGGWRIMERRSDDLCLAVITAETVAELRRAKQPGALA